MKKIFVFFLFFQSALSAFVITDNIAGEYFDTVNNSVARFIYLQLTLSEGACRLESFTPIIYPYVTEAVEGAKLANIKSKRVFVDKNLSEIQASGNISIDFEVEFIPNASQTIGYQGSMQFLGQIISSNVFSLPNPVQYFLLEMNPISPGRVQNVYCDLFINGISAKKWLLPSYTNYITQGIFVSSSWESNLIVKTKKSEKVNQSFTFQIPYSSFIGLQDGVYQLRALVVMNPVQEVVGLKLAQIGTLQKLLNQAYATASGNNSVYIPNASQLVNINQNISYLNNLIVEIESSN